MIFGRKFMAAMVGVGTLGLTFTAVALSGKAPSTSPGLYPDLRAAVPHHFTVQNDHQHEYLRFSNLIGNTGQGDLRLRPEHDPVTGVTTAYQEIFDANGNMVLNTPVSTFLFHPEHNHWHADRVALFEIRKALDNGTGGKFGAVYGGQSVKTTFCLIDVVKLDDNSRTPERNYWDCFPDAHQGISAGWGDQYHQALEGQELEITGAPSGIYYLISTSNPDGNFRETTTANNTAWTSFRVTRDSQGNAKVSEVSHSPCSGTLCGEDLPNRG
jgi:Lysyl oxidase